MTVPIYEYQCQECGTRTEVLQKLSDPPVEKCVSCGGQMKKLMSAPAIQFKGSGWYITDYARKNSAPAGHAERSAGGNGGSSPEKDTKKESPTKSSGEGTRPTSSPKTATGSKS